MSIVGHDELGSGRQGAFDVEVILRISQEWPEAKPRQGRDADLAQSVQQLADLIWRDPRVRSQGSRTQQHVLVLDDHRGGEREVISPTSIPRRMRFDAPFLERRARTMTLASATIMDRT
ncbi:hypothetical protein ATO4_05177 [Aurantimonas sp. 22II-16-19i]|nr:hypothetical protein ATO4_05177 [Aurantimonas sp. 22II-16-19i]